MITILVAFLEAAAQQLRPPQPAVVMRFGGEAKKQRTATFANLGLSFAATSGR